MSLHLRDVEPDDVDAVQRLIEADPGYVERVTGHPPAPADAQSLLLVRPPDLPPEDKRVLGAWQDLELVALVDLLRGFPDAGSVHVGLLQVHAAHQGRGLGRRVHDLVAEEVARWAPAATTLRAAIVETNAAVAAPFWAVLGYRPVGEPRPYRYDALETTVRIWTRPVGSRPSPPGPTGRS